ncbi:MAG TPA: methylated-DNA--[protein]-cysteine S-methyltransferase [Pirellulales bacterium]|jgi:methylated-DNA-[protein]-cysteine S-methyltransferase|nr:methylated-DNA--[protein]-cysteine S-methyltransferase [Pirellulales bacterium]
MHDELTAFRTAFGWCAMLGRGPKLRALTFGHRNSEAAMAALESQLTADARRSSWNRPLAQRLVDALEGEPDLFTDVEVDFDHLTPFSRRVAAACRRIPWGETRSYGQLAATAGRPAAARAVGRVMSQNRTPLIVPCHRVIGSSGRLVGFSAPQGIALKRRLLALESAVLCS